MEVAVGELAQRAESRLTEKGLDLLSVARSMFMADEIDHFGLAVVLTDVLGFSDEESAEYVTEACDANDGDPC
jgi:arginine/ornithine N-succinyltransferase beta subunit